MPTIKIKPTHKESQGDFVLIEEEDFNADIHQHYDEKPTRSYKVIKDAKEPVGDK
jgi:hypothetical protein